jgi:hypothetical protein
VLDQDIYAPLAVGLDGRPSDVAIVRSRVGDAFFRPASDAHANPLDVDQAAVVHDLQTHAVRLEQMQGHLVQLVGDARAEGVSWALIGWSLGITKEGARKRFSGAIPQQHSRR